MLDKPEKLVLVGLMLATAQIGTVRAEKLLTDTVEQPVAGDFAPRPSTVNLFEGDILRGPQTLQRGIGVHAGYRVWEDGIVPFYLDPELTPEVVSVVESAIATWNGLAGISLVEINPNERDSPEDYLHFILAGGCASWIGKQGGAQSVWTAPSCSSGSMMHEIGHALGLEHEHTRPDRDQYIKINRENVISGKLANFNISDSEKQYYGHYDLASIMHYGEYFFSANGKRTIEPLTSIPIELGQRLAPSPGDVASIAEIYGTDLSLVSSVNTTGDSTEVSLLVTNESNQGANNIDIEFNIGDATLLSNTNEYWDCSTQAGLLNCSFKRLPGTGISNLELMFDKALVGSELNITLSSKTPDNNISNNVGIHSLAAAQLAGSSTPQAGAANPVYSDDVPDNGRNTANVASMSHWLLGFLLMSVGIRRQCYSAKSPSE